MKKGSKARKCGSCGRVVFWIIPDKPMLNWLPTSTTQKVLDYRYRKEKGAEYGHYYCMNCLKQKFPDEY